MKIYKKRNSATPLYEYQRLKKYKCLVCNRTFKFYWQLRNHIYQKLCKFKRVKNSQLENVEYCHSWNLNEKLQAIDCISNNPNTGDKDESCLKGSVKQPNTYRPSLSLGKHKIPTYNKLNKRKLDDFRKMDEEPTMINKPFKCTIYNKLFKNKITLNFHYERQHTIKSFACQSCEKSFAKYWQLRSHNAVHEVKKTFACSICNAKYKTALYLRHHITSCHPSDLSNYKLSSEDNPSEFISKTGLESCVNASCNLKSQNSYDSLEVKGRYQFNEPFANKLDTSFYSLACSYKSEEILTWSADYKVPPALNRQQNKPLNNKNFNILNTYLQNNNSFNMYFKSPKSHVFNEYHNMNVYTRKDSDKPGDSLYIKNNFNHSLIDLNHNNIVENDASFYPKIPHLNYGPSFSLLNIALIEYMISFNQQKKAQCSKQILDYFDFYEATCSHLDYRLSSKMMPVRPFNFLDVGSNQSQAYSKYLEETNKSDNFLTPIPKYTCHQKPFDNINVLQASCKDAFCNPYIWKSDSMQNDKKSVIVQNDFAKSLKDGKEKKIVKSSKATSSISSNVSLQEGDAGPCVCEECGSKLKNKSSLKFHMQRQHPKGELFYCPMCPKSFGKHWMLRNHQLTHKDKYPCSFCGKNLKNRFDLQQHVSLFHEKYLKLQPKP